MSDRFTLNYSEDKRIFATTANRTRTINLFKPMLYRGGFRI